MADSDIVTIHLVSSARTHHLVGEAEIAAMRPTAYLVNTSRGPIVDTAALLDALHAGRIAGAAIDVYDTEPLPADHPLRSAPRTVLTPHLGYVTDDGYDLFFREVVEDIAAWRAGAPMRVLDSAQRRRVISTSTNSSEPPDVEKMPRSGGLSP